jgi:hypothetical protein
MRSLQTDPPLELDGQPVALDMWLAVVRRYDLTDDYVDLLSAYCRLHQALADIEAEAERVGVCSEQLKKAIHKMRRGLFRRKGE